jgi:ubiquitin
MMSMLPLPDPALDPTAAAATCSDSLLQRRAAVHRPRHYQATSNQRFFAACFYTKYLHAPGSTGQPNLLAERQRSRFDAR